MDWPGTLVLVSALVVATFLLGFRLGIARRVPPHPALPPGYLDRLTREHTDLYQAAVFHFIRKRYGCSASAAERILDDYNDWETTAVRSQVRTSAERDLVLHDSVIALLDRWATRDGLVVPAQAPASSDHARAATPPN